MTSGSINLEYLILLLSLIVQKPPKKTHFFEEVFALSEVLNKVLPMRYYDLTVGTWLDYPAQPGYTCWVWA
jgi:hypothetical protein